MKISFSCWIMEEIKSSDNILEFDSPGTAVFRAAEPYRWLFFWA